MLTLLGNSNAQSSKYLTYRIPTRQSCKTVVKRFFFLLFFSLTDDSPCLNKVYLLTYLHAGGEAAVRFSSSCGVKESDFVVVLFLRGGANGRLLVVQML